VTITLTPGSLFLEHSLDKDEKKCLKTFWPIFRRRSKKSGSRQQIQDGGDNFILDRRFSAHAIDCSQVGRVTRDRCYDFKNIFAENFC
jgi:hypothetical protein